MRNRTKQSPDSPKRTVHKLIVILIGITVLGVGVVTAVSRQSGQTQDAKVEEGKPQGARQMNRNYVTSNASGQMVVVDRQTGQARPLTADEARRLAEGIKQLVNQSTEGLVQVHHADGSVSMDLQGRFQNVLLAKKEADGTISQACVDNVESAAAFFEIDPELVGAAVRVEKSKSASTKLEIR